MNVDLSKKPLGRCLSVISKKISNIFFLKGIKGIKKMRNIYFYNIKKTILTGNKKKNKFFYRHTGYLGGLKKINYYKEFIYNKEIIKNSLKKMLSKNFLFNKIKKKIKIL
ncbi:uL13 family ribosomal protein [Candidatus Vidania fulgoroideorum]